MYYIYVRAQGIQVQVSQVSVIVPRLVFPLSGIY